MASGPDNSPRHTFVMTFRNFFSYQDAKEFLERAVVNEFDRRYGRRLKVEEIVKMEGLAVHNRRIKPLK